MDSILPQRMLKLDFYGVLFLLLQIVACFNSLLPFASAKSDGVCVSSGGCCPPYSIQGKPPGRVNKALNLCRLFHKKRWCDVAQTHAALLSIRRLVSTGEASNECLHFWELLECSISDPRVGVQAGSSIICSSLCDRIYDACSNVYFAMDAKNQVLAPCGIGDTGVRRASEWVTNGTELCKDFGFSVKPSNDFKETFCNGGKASLESVVLWAVGGLIFTAGLLFVSMIIRRATIYKQLYNILQIKRKSHNLQAAVQHTARNEDGKGAQSTLLVKRPKYPASQANRK